MISDKVKYLADFILSLCGNGMGAGDNYRQFPLPLAILVCLVAFGVLGLLLSAGVMILSDALF